MQKNWTGTPKSIYTILGASSHTDKEREAHDYYATDPIAVDVLVQEEKFSGSIWEPACGEGHLSKRLAYHGYKVISSDLVDRGYGMAPVDFLSSTTLLGHNIVTNPPYRYALEFAEHGLSLLRPGYKLALFLKLQFLEGKRRKAFFQSNPFRTLYVSSSRILCAKNAEFQKMRDGGGSAVAYGWYVWEKGFCRVPGIKWVN